MEALLFKEQENLVGGFLIPSLFLGKTLSPKGAVEKKRILAQGARWGWGHFGSPLIFFFGFFHQPIGFNSSCSTTARMSLFPSFTPSHQKTLNLNRKTCTAPAGFSGIGIGKRKSTAVEAAFKINFHAPKVHSMGGVHNE